LVGGIRCGSGRWTKHLAPKVKFIEAIDPSDAVFVADELLWNIENVRISKASTDNIPFEDETFDFGMSIGVLHHIPDTQKALTDCVKKIKSGGYFYLYLYYSLDNRGSLFKTLLSVVTGLRKITSSLPSGLKKIVCDLIALFIYMPSILTGRLFRKIGLDNLSKKLPLSGYIDQSFFVIRNDALDRFGTKLEQRFSKREIIEMMKSAGLDELAISDNIPYWHAVGKKVK
jgi:SAM-dependent methyltransferase